MTSWLVSRLQRGMRSRRPQVTSIDDDDADSGGDSESDEEPDFTVVPFDPEKLTLKDLTALGHNVDTSLRIVERDFELKEDARESAMTVNFRNARNHVKEKIQAMSEQRLLGDWSLFYDLKGFQT